MMSWTYLLITACGIAVVTAARANGNLEAWRQAVAPDSKTTAISPAGVSALINHPAVVQLRRVYEEDLSASEKMLEILLKVPEVFSSRDAAEMVSSLQQHNRSYKEQIETERKKLAPEIVSEVERWAQANYFPKKAEAQASIEKQWRRINELNAQSPPSDTTTPPSNPIAARNPFAPQQSPTTSNGSITGPQQPAPDATAADPNENPFLPQPGTVVSAPPAQLVPDTDRQLPIPGRDGHLPLSVNDLDMRIQRELMIGSQPNALDFIRARLLTQDGEKLLEAVRWSPALERVVSTLSWGITAEPVGFGGQVAPANLRPADAVNLPRARKAAFDQSHLAIQLSGLTGDAGKWLSQGLQSRVDSDEFGDWDARTTRHEHQARGIWLLAPGALDSLLADARRDAIDVLLVANIERKAADVSRTDSRMTVRFYDVENKKALWTSATITTAQVQAGRRRGKDPATELAENGLAYIDKSLALKSAPDMTAEQAHKRLQQITAAKRPSMLADLVELRYFQLKELISKEEASAAYAKLLGAQDGALFAQGDAAGRLKAIKRFLPVDF